MAMQTCRTPLTMRIVHLRALEGSGASTSLKVPDPFSSHEQQGKDREIASSFNSKHSQTGTWLNVRTKVQFQVCVGVSMYVL